MVSACIQVTRIIGGEEIDVDVYLSGQTETYSSANYHESGERLADWYVEEPKGFELTKHEEARAEEALDDAI